MGALLARIPDGLVFVIVLTGLLLWEFGALDSRPVNPEVMATFEAIVEQCQAEEFPFETQRCRNVLYITQYCRARRRTVCTVGDYYRVMERMGYVLPPLHHDEPAHPP